MTTDKTELKKESKLKMICSYAAGDTNSEMEIIATKDGLEIDEIIIILWEWIRLSSEIIHGKEVL